MRRYVSRRFDVVVLPRQFSSTTAFSYSDRLAATGTTRKTSINSVVIIVRLVWVPLAPKRTPASLTRSVAMMEGRVTCMPEGKVASTSLSRKVVIKLTGKLAGRFITSLSAFTVDGNFDATLGNIDSRRKAILNAGRFGKVPSLRIRAPSFTRTRGRALAVVWDRPVRPISDLALPRRLERLGLRRKPTVEFGRARDLECEGCALAPLSCCETARCC